MAAKYHLARLEFISVIVRRHTARNNPLRMLPSAMLVVTMASPNEKDVMRSQRQGLQAPEADRGVSKILIV